MFKMDDEQMIQTTAHTMCPAVLFSIPCLNLLARVYQRKENLFSTPEEKQETVNTACKKMCVQERKKWPEREITCVSAERKVFWNSLPGLNGKRTG